MCRGCRAADGAILLQGPTRYPMGVQKLDGPDVMTMGVLEVPLQPPPDGVWPHRTGGILGKL